MTFYAIHKEFVCGSNKHFVSDFTSSYLPMYMHTHLHAHIYLHTFSDIIKESYVSVVGSYGCRDFRGCNVSPPNCFVMY